MAIKEAIFKMKVHGANASPVDITVESLNFVITEIN